MVVAAGACDAAGLAGPAATGRGAEAGFAVDAGVPWAAEAGFPCADNPTTAVPRTALTNIFFSM